MLKIQNYKLIKALTYCYFYCQLFDGIFRKWILPSLSSQIMIIKNIIAILIFAYGLNIFMKSTIWEKSFFFIGILVFLTSLAFGHGNIIVAIWGCIPYWFGISISFIIGYIMTQKDIRKIFKIIVILSIFNSIIIICQFLLPPSNILNYRGGEISENIASTSVSDLSGMYRPAGIFMHSTHNCLFSLLAISTIMYFAFIERNIIKKKYIYIALFLEIISCICSASRTNIFLHIGFLIYFIILCLNKKTINIFLRRLIIIIPVGIIIFLSPIGNKAVTNLGKRFANASESQFSKSNTIEGTILDIYSRTIKYNLEAIISPKTLNGEDVPFWGFGQGLSTQVGGRLIGINKNSGFALAEWDGLRIMCESGYLFGWIIIFIRMGYTLRFIPQIIIYKRNAKFMPIIIYPSFFISFYLLENWGNSFLANFAFLVAGLFLASVKIYKSKSQI